MRYAALMLAIAATCMAAEWWEEEMKEQEQAIEEGAPVQAAVGAVLWTKGYIEVVGEATCDMDEALDEADCYLRGRRAAIALAQEKLSETVNGIVIDGETLLKNELLRSSVLRTRTMGLVKGAAIVNEDRVKLEDGSILARVWMRLPMYGEGGIAEPILAHAAELAAQRPVPTFSVAKPPAPSKNFTGIVVDASGIDAKPAQAPKLLVLEDLAAALSIEQIDLATARSIGVVEYAGSMEDALTLADRVGESPLVLKAVSSHGTTGCDLVISAEDGRRLAAADPDRAMIRACRVVFVGSFI